MAAAGETRYRALIEYDGTDFLGFQRQATGRTVQGTLETALAAIGWRGKAVLGAGRTDSGVHAAGQVVAFDFGWQHGTADLLRALNANLPADIAVQAVDACPADFHPRYSARGRVYRYTLYNQPVRSPLAARYSWQVWPRLDLAALQAAGAFLVGQHDFATFGTDPERGENTVRTVTRAEWSAAPGGWLRFEIQAEAFLFRMVRSLVGALRRVGQGELSGDSFGALLRARDRAQCPPIAPPQGLCLVEVVY
jgi:tRNA pseudouridine38-40 synthase